MPSAPEPPGRRGRRPSPHTRSPAPRSSDRARELERLGHELRRAARPVAEVDDLHDPVAAVHAASRTRCPPARSPTRRPRRRRRRWCHRRRRRRRRHGRHPPPPPESFSCGAVTAVAALTDAVAPAAASPEPSARDRRRSRYPRHRRESAVRVTVGAVRAGRPPPPPPTPSSPSPPPPPPPPATTTRLERGAALAHVGGPATPAAGIVLVFTAAVAAAVEPTGTGDVLLAVLAGAALVHLEGLARVTADRGRRPAPPTSHTPRCWHPVRPGHRTRRS